MNDSSNQVSLANQTELPNAKAVGVWLFICAITVYVMIVVGGVTRLTQSGLSMVEWEPIMGAIPPLSLMDWQETFAKYQASPEYQKVNMGMSLEGFKRIFWWEYGHRMLGRFVGLLFFLPYLFFLFRGYLTGAWKGKLFGLFVLGGMQAVVGWYMVKSGLIDNPHVSQYRLAAHFGIALMIYAVMVWFMLDFLKTEKRRAPIALKRIAFGVAKLIFLMMITGAFVAGLKAGHIYNTFPLMGEGFIPKNVLSITPAWRNIFENPVTVQFVHRCIAYVVMIAVFVLFFKGRKLIAQRTDVNIRTNLTVLLGLMLCQVLFGIITLLNKVPVFWGALHQFTGVALLTSALFLAHRLSRDY